MRTIIAGSRNITDYNVLLQAIQECPFSISTILSGTARGVDKMGERFAVEQKIPLEKYPADWNKYGKSAGYKRNELMAEKAEALLSIWDGKSKGTKNMINIAKIKGLKVYIYKI